MGIFDQIKSAVSVKEIVEMYHAPLNRNNKVCCPFHQEKTASLSIDINQNMWKCFGCGLGGDGIRFVAKLKGIEDIDAAKMIIQDFHLNIDYESESSKTPQGEMRNYIRECQKHVEETNYFEQRGLASTTIKEFGLGYDPKDKSVVIPYSPSMVYYQKRFVKDKRFYKPDSEKYGHEPIWHPENLELKDKTPVFIVESPICAMSIAQYGGKAVALCGTSNVSRFADFVATKKPHGTPVICMDNDEPGKKAEKELVARFKAMKQKHIVYNIAGECKDPNELLLKSANKLCKNIALAKKEAILNSREREDIISLEALCNLGVKPKEFIVENMIPEDALCVLAAASKVGKSWFVLQLAIAIVCGETFLEEQTHPCSVLYYALEDSDSRMVYRKNKLTNGKEIPKNLYIKMETKTFDTGLLEEIEHYQNRIPNLKLVIIDTLQLVRGTPRRNEGAYAFDYREMSVLRKFCADNKVTLIMVHHSRKQEDDGDTFNMISGSNGIMGASDATLFINRKKRMDENEPFKMSQTGRDVKQCERLIERSEDGHWSKVANAEEKARRQEEQAFNNSKVVQLILALMKKQPSGWSGTTREFVKEGINLFNEHIGTESEVGKEINRIELELLRKHRINHEWKRSSGGNRHFFKPSSPPSLFNYHGDDDDN